MNVKDKKAIVTGASSGIGRALSELLIQKEATVYGLARSKDDLQSLQKTLGERFKPAVVDITQSDTIDTWVNDTFSDNENPDLLINNAGLGIYGNVEDLSMSDWHTMINTNLNGIFYMTRRIVPMMKEDENVNHIINIASIAGKVGNPTMTGYNASKFGVRGFSEALFQEVRYDGIKVTCFYPGSVQTHFFDTAEGADAHSNMMQPQDLAKTITDVIDTPDNFLINEIVMRPLNPKPPED